MQKKLANILFSTRLTGILFIVYAVAMITGTFLDAGQETSPTPFTRHYIYNALWFEAIMVLFMINFIGNIFRYRLLRKEKWATLTLHLAFIFILLGAGITRYIGYEGWMQIREGATENTYLTSDIYLTAFIDGDLVVDGQQQRRVIQERVDFSERLDNDLRLETEYNNTPVTIEVKKFVKDAELDIIPGDTGDRYLKLVEAGDGGGSHSHFIRDGQDALIHNVVFTLNNPKKGAINITTEGRQLFIESPFEGNYMTMATQETGTLVKDSIQPLALRSRYQIGTMAMVFPTPVMQGEFGIVKKSELLRANEDGVVVDITANGETKTVNLLGGKHVNGQFEQVNLRGLDVAVKYGSVVKELPFSIKLNDFIAERYPGTEDNFSAFASEVTVIKENETPYDYRIFMNHVLDEEGFRFFQSSFYPDEKGTKLSVNHDRWGTYVTYFGYMLLYFGLMAILFSKGTRFADLNRMLEKVKAKKSKLLTVLLIAFGMLGFAQEHSENDGHDHGATTTNAPVKIERPTKAEIDSVIRANIVPKAHADKFGELVIQDYSGRMMPMNTYASEVLRKLSKRDHYEEFDANQVLLSMQESPLFWYNVPVIYLAKRKGDSIRNIIGIPKDQKYVSITDFLTDDGRNKLGPYLEEAYATDTPNGFQKEFREAYDRMSLLFNTLDGRSIKIFPVPDDEKNTWISSVEYREDYKEKIQDTLYGNYVQNSFGFYLGELYKAKQSGDFELVNKLLNGFKNSQKQLGSEVMLSDDKIKTEILYNKYDIFKRLFAYYMIAGSILFIVLIVQIFNDKSKFINILVKILAASIVAMFIVHTGGLIVRWYISGHAPWSDAYESMIYVAWATMFFGLAFGRKSMLTLAATAFVTSMILMVAHWSWMDPAIANLQPVLDSYWLMIHVAVIVASYGPFTLGMVLGVTVLLLMIFTTKKNKAKMDLNIKELTIINEMALTVGLVMLTIGNFLGGMWANESWGRYWGWDPKETWALISIMFYAFVIHMRLIPGLRGRFGFNLMSIIAFASIIFTYFGVNFYLSGLHSYQSGQQILSYQYIGITVGLVVLLALVARRSYVKFYKK